MVQNCRGTSLRLREFASLASTHPSHAERDLHTWVDAAHSLGVEPYVLRFHLAGRQQLRPSETRLHVLPIPLLLHAFCELGPRHFAASMLGGKAVEAVQDLLSRFLFTYLIIVE